MRMGSHFESGSSVRFFLMNFSLLLLLQAFSIGKRFKQSIHVFKI